MEDLETRERLVRIETKVDGVLSRLEYNSREFDQLEGRTRILEQWQGKVVGIGIVLIAVVSAVFTAAASAFARAF